MNGKPTHAIKFTSDANHNDPFKIMVIKTIRSITGLGLKDSKDMAEKFDIPSHCEIGKSYSIELNLGNSDLEDVRAKIEHNIPIKTLSIVPLCETKLIGKVEIDGNFANVRLQFGKNQLVMTTTVQYIGPTIKFFMDSIDA